MKLSKSQEELLDAMKRGVVVHGIFGIDSYYFRSDSFRRCTRPAEALIARGLIERFNDSWRGCTLRVKEK